MKESWSYSVAAYSSSQDQVTAYFFVGTLLRPLINAEDIENLHIVASQMRASHSVEYVAEITMKVLDAFDKYQRLKLIGFTSDGESNMVV